MESVTLIAVGISVLFLLLCFTIAALLYVSGILSPIDVGAGLPPIGKATVAYKFARGPYKNSGELFNEVTKHAPEYRCVGIYYDDPKRIPEEKLRYAVGAILSEGDVKVEKELLDQLEKAGFNIITLPQVTHCVKTTFPFINTMSILIAVWRVYPRVSRYVEEHKLCAYPFLEIYEGSTIHFMAPLSMQDEFFVPESKQNIPSEYEQDSFIDNTSGSPSFYDGSPSSSTSRSMSRYTNASHMFSDDQDDSDMDESFYRNTPSMDRNTPSVGKESLNIQDEEVTSSVDVRPSKAKTNLLEDDNVSADEHDVLRQGSPVMNEDKAKLDESASMLHDSGVCSGRTSAVPSEANTSLEVEKKVGLEDNDSASSFEEISME